MRLLIDFKNHCGFCVLIKIIIFLNKLCTALYVDRLIACVLVCDIICWVTHLFTKLSFITMPFPFFILPNFCTSGLSNNVTAYVCVSIIRDYQFNIVQNVLFRNVLVCLLTDLGKMFIAAVVMYNFYCWYPSGKIVFLVPTKLNLLSN